MLSVTLLCVGRMREAYYMEAFAEYAKRLGAFCRLAVTELPEQRLPERPAASEIDAALEKEAREILRLIPKGAATVALCVEGERMTSPELARRLAAVLRRGRVVWAAPVGEARGGPAAEHVGPDVSASPRARHAHRAALSRVYDQRGRAVSQINCMGEQQE